MRPPGTAIRGSARHWSRATSPASEVTVVDFDLTWHEDYMLSRLETTDLLIDATHRLDPSLPVVPNAWISAVPEDAVILDLAARPVRPRCEPTDHQGDRRDPARRSERVRRRATSTGTCSTSTTRRGTSSPPRFRRGTGVPWSRATRGPGPSETVHGAVRQAARSAAGDPCGARRVRSCPPRRLVPRASALSREPPCMAPSRADRRARPGVKGRRPRSARSPGFRASRRGS